MGDTPEQSNEYYSKDDDTEKVSITCSNDDLPDSGSEVWLIFDATENSVCDAGEYFEDNNGNDLLDFGEDLTYGDADGGQQTPW